MKALLGSKRAKGRWAGSRRARGAAMVEAIVIMGTMLVFLGMNTWAFKAYGGKIDQMSSTRRDSLYYASHSCEKKNGQDPDDYTTAELRGNNASGGSSMTLMGIVDVIRGRSGFDFFGTARSQKGPTAVAGTALTKVGALGVDKTPLTANLKTASAVGCNEKPMGNGVLALLNMGWNFVKSLFN
jgi:hypothetical protein